MYIFVFFFLKVKGLARDIYEKYFKAAQTQPRGVVAKLGNIVAQIERACQKQVKNVYTELIDKKKFQSDTSTGLEFSLLEDSGNYKCIQFALNRYDLCFLWKLFIFELRMDVKV